MNLAELQRGQTRAKRINEVVSELGAAGRAVAETAETAAGWFETAQAKTSAVVRLVHSHSMASHTHLLFLAMSCLGSAAVVYALRTKAKKPDLTVEEDSTIFGAPLGMLEISGKPAVDVGQPDIKIEEDLPISDVHFPTTEIVAGSADVLGADISRPDVGHTSNGEQQISMSSTSPTHEADDQVWPEKHLTLQHPSISPSDVGDTSNETHPMASGFLDSGIWEREQVQCRSRGKVWSEANKFWMQREMCPWSNGKEVVYHSGSRYWAMNPAEHMFVQVQVGSPEFNQFSKFYLGKIDYEHTEFRCIMMDRCDEVLKFIAVPKGKYKEQHGDYFLCCWFV